MQYESNQQVFDLACEHLAKQGKPARDDKNNCQYKTPDGLKCAVGALIPDDLYLQEFETIVDSSISTINRRYETIKSLFENVSVELLRKLQIAHDDSFSIKNLKDQLHDLAEKYDLDASKVELIKKWN